MGGKSGGVREVEPGVFCATGTDVNWVILCEGDEVTLIDSGYPADARAVETSLAEIGSSPAAVRAILLTHSHIDHMGSINHFHRRYATPVYAAAAETPMVRGQSRQQAGPRDVVRNLWRPGVLGWSLRITRAGATRTQTFPEVRPLPADGALDLPGRPVPVVTGGHTSGHTAYHLPAAGVLVTGDELATGHPVSRVSGPQILPSMFNHCGRAESLAALDALAGLDAGAIVPGHGEPARVTVAEALAAARRNAEDPRHW